MRTRGWLRLGAAAVAVLAFNAGTAWAQWQIGSKDGKAWLKFGFLIQPQMELLETVDQRATSTNLFVRRVRVLFGGNDQREAGRSSSKPTARTRQNQPNPVARQASRNQATCFVEAPIVTYNHIMAFKVDAG